MKAKQAIVTPLLEPTGSVPLADNLFTWPSNSPQLIGVKCQACGTVTFPIQDHCPACCSSSVEKMLLPRRGTLWTWTIQGFPPKAPPYRGDIENFASFGVGYIELPDATRVEARLIESDPSELKIGMEMELVILPLLVEKNGDQVITYAFKGVAQPRKDDT